MKLVMVTPDLSSEIFYHDETKNKDLSIIYINDRQLVFKFMKAIIVAKLRYQTGVSQVYTGTLEVHSKKKWLLFKRTVKREIDFVLNIDRHKPPILVSLNLYDRHGSIMVTYVFSKLLDLDEPPPDYDSDLPPAYDNP